MTIATRFGALLAMVALLSGPASATGGADLPLPSGTIALDGFVDPAYELLDEQTYAAPADVGGGQAEASAPATRTTAPSTTAGTARWIR